MGRLGKVKRIGAPESGGKKGEDNSSPIRHGGDHYRGNDKKRGLKGVQDASMPEITKKKGEGMERRVSSSGSGG